MGCIGTKSKRKHQKRKSEIIKNLNNQTERIIKHEAIIKIDITFLLFRSFKNIVSIDQKSYSSNIKIIELMNEAFKMVIFYINKNSSQVDEDTIKDYDFLINNKRYSYNNKEVSFEIKDIFDNLPIEVIIYKIPNPNSILNSNLIGYVLPNESSILYVFSINEMKTISSSTLDFHVVQYANLTNNKILLRNQKEIIILSLIDQFNGDTFYINFDFLNDLFDYIPIDDLCIYLIGKNTSSCYVLYTPINERKLEIVKIQPQTESKLNFLSYVSIFYRGYIYSFTSNGVQILDILLNSWTLKSNFNINDNITLSNLKTYVVFVYSSKENYLLFINSNFKNELFDMDLSSLITQSDKIYISPKDYLNKVVIDWENYSNIVNVISNNKLFILLFSYENKNKCIVVNLIKFDYENIDI